MTKYWAIFKTQTINNIAYAGDLAVGSVTILLFLWIFAQLWRVTYGAVGATTIAGLSLSDTLWYLMVAETIILSRPRLNRVIAQQVRDGSVAYLLNKPYHFLLYQASVGMGDTVLRMGLNMLFGGIMVWLLAGPPPAPAGLPLVLIAIFLAWWIDFCISSLIGLAAFITEDVTAFEWIYSKILFILGGLLIPLDFYPGWLQTIAKSLPFAYTVYGPARLFVDPSLSRFGQLVLFQGVWLILLGGLVAWMFNRGMRWLSINGG